MKNISRKLSRIIKLYEQLYNDEQFQIVKGSLIKAITLTENIQLFVKREIKIKMKNGIHLKCASLAKEPEKSFWYVFGHLEGKIKYLHKDGTWNESCLNPINDIDISLYSGNYENKEEAIETIKKYTKFIMVYNDKEEEEYI